MKLNIKPKIYYVIIVFFLVISSVFAVAMIHIFGVLPENEQTFVGTIAISNYEEDQYESILNSEIYNWDDNASFTLSYQNIKFDIPMDIFEANIPQTIANIIKNSRNSIVFSIPETQKVSFIQSLSNRYSSSIVDLIDVDQLYNTMLYDAGNMATLETYYLDEYLLDSAKETVLTSFTLSNINVDDVLSITNSISLIEISAKERFYLLDYLESYSLTNEQLSIVASGLLGVSLESHLDNFIYEQSSILSSWGSQGRNVRILKANHYDFSFYNAYRYSLSVEISKTDDNSVLFELIGCPYVNDYDIFVNSITNIPFSTEYIENSLIDENTPGVIITETEEEYLYQILVSPGVDGDILEIKRTVTNPEGNGSTKVMFYETYQPTNEVIEENSVEKEVN